MQKENITRKLVFMGVMTALAVICSLDFPLGFTFRVAGFMKFSPAFLIVGIVASVCGWKQAGLVSLLTDVIQGFLFGNFSILIALINLLMGICFGLFLYKKSSIFNICAAVVLTQIIGSLTLITAVLCVRFGMPFIPTIYWRGLQTVIMIAVEIPVLWLFIRVIKIPDKIAKILNI